MAEKVCPTLEGYIGDIELRRWHEEFNALSPEEQERRRNRCREEVEERRRIMSELIDGHGEPLREPTPFEEWYLRNH